MVQIYRIIVVGVLCSSVLLASLERTPYEVNTFHFFNRRTMVYAPLTTDRQPFDLPTAYSNQPIDGQTTFDCCRHSC